MFRLLQINVTANWGSTGRIAEEIGQLVIKEGGESCIAYGRKYNGCDSKVIRIGNKIDVYSHLLETRLFDRHGLGSRGATEKLIKQIKSYSPDIIHLHNIHGYYLNYPLLFEYLRYSNIPVVWTLHDCWPLTGHCAHFMGIECEKWQHECYDCPLKHQYPASMFVDASRNNFKIKKKSFLGLGNLSIVTVSKALEDYVKKSFLSEYKVQTIYNGVNLDIYHPMTNKSNKFILGVASVWPKSKGLETFFSLRKLLPESYKIVLVGLSNKQVKNLPNGIIGISRTENRTQLVELYSKASVLVNPTLEDSFPTVNLEALACGTPVVTYRTGGSPEAIDDKTGVVVERGDIRGLINAIYHAEKLKPEDCRQRAERKFNKDICFKKYLELYNDILRK